MEQEEERKIEQKEEEKILKSIKKVDSNFDYEKFKEFSSNVYVKLQEIWSERNIDELKNMKQSYYLNNIKHNYKNILIKDKEM